MSLFGNNIIFDLLVAISLLLLGYILNLFSIGLCKKFDIVDYPNNSGLKIQKNPTPLSGGFAILLTFMVSVFALSLIFNINLYAQIGYISISLLLVTIFGAFDDKSPISAKVRLPIYIAISALIYLLFVTEINIGIVWIFLAVLLFAPGIITSANMIDGMDGLCAGTSIISLAGFLIIGIFFDQNLTIVVSIAAILALLPFLIVNFNPAKAFLGSSGSELIGFIFFVLAFLSTKGSDDYTLVFRILLIGIPVIDMIRVMIIRLKNHKPITYGDRNHIYDKFLTAGMTQKKVWALMILLQMVIVSVAIWVNMYIN